MDETELYNQLVQLLREAAIYIRRSGVFVSPTMAAAIRESSMLLTPKQRDAALEEFFEALGRQDA